MTTPVWVSAVLAPELSRALEMPKSMTRGPVSVSRMLDGFRSRWTRFSAWMEASASASPALRSRTPAVRSGPPSAILLWRGPRDVLARDPRLGGVGVSVHHGGGPVTADPHRRLDLPAETPTETGIVGDVVPDHLDRDPAAGRGPAEIDTSHRATAESAEKPVGPDLPRIARYESVQRCAPPRSLGSEHIHWRRTASERRGRPSGQSPLPVPRRSTRNPSDARDQNSSGGSRLGTSSTRIV
jgi:hypothetical protein